MAEQASFSEQADLRPGVTLGDYSLEQVLEQLETGPLFLARHTQAGTRHRLRVLMLPTAFAPEDRLIALGQFQKIAGQLAALQHASLLPLSDYGSNQQLTYLVSHALPAQSLHALLAKRGPMSPLLAGRYLDGITTALEYAHQQGILHLNLSFRSIFIRADDSVVVADFALPRLFSAPVQLDAPAPQGLAPLLDRKGKLLYGLDLSSAPAPELLLGEPVDARADVYALGAVLYQMLTGHRVFRGATVQEIAGQHLNAVFPPLSVWRRDLPATFDALLRQTLAKAPAQRLRSPGVLADAYHQLVSPADRARQPFSSYGQQAPLTPRAAKQDPASASLTRGAAKRAIKAPASLSRRRVIVLAAAGGGIVVVAGAAIALIGPSLSGNNSTHVATGSNGASSLSGTPATPASTGRSPSNLLARTSDVPVNSAKSFPIAQSNNPGLLIHLPDNRFVAFNSTCTHAGCGVSYNARDHLLECPCHGAAFDPSNNAAVVQGPAQTSLASISISVNADNTITLNN